MADATFSFDTYLSPFTTRYGSDTMRRIWSEENRRLTLRKVWVALAKAQYSAGLLKKKELSDIQKHATDIDIPKAQEIEKDMYHELMAEITLFSQQAPLGGGKIHLGATSADILDSGQMLQIQEALRLVKTRLTHLLRLFSERITRYQDTVCMAYTHLQPAEPTTLGYRFALYAQDILFDLKLLENLQPLLLTKGLKGAVGTSASYQQLLGGTGMSVEALEQQVLDELGLSAVTVSGQTYPRKIDLLIVELLANIAASLHKFCFDYRILMQPSIGEWGEERNAKRVGSSAMPFKRNPDKAEKVCSLCRYVGNLLPTAWSNPALSLLERTLDDSANQRLFLPEGFLAIDECLITTTTLLQTLTINIPAVERNLAHYGQFAGIEPLLMTLVKKHHANRQEMHEVLKQKSMQVWNAWDSGENLSLTDVLSHTKEITQYLSEKEIEQLLDPTHHIGNAHKQTQQFLKQLAPYLSESDTV